MGSDDDGDNSYGPSLPPQLIKERQEQQRRPVGPQIPAEMLQALREGRDVSEMIQDANDGDDDEAFGPQLPASLKRPVAAVDTTANSDDDDDDIVGPQMYMAERPEEREASSLSQTMSEVEERAERMRARLRGEEEPGPQKAERGEWMMKPPEQVLSFDILRPRNFSMKGYNPEQDRSLWTDTPADKARKREEAKDSSKKKHKTSKDEDDHERIMKRDTEIDREVQQYNEKHRPKSLMDEYKTKHIGKRLEAVDDVASRGFDRDKDLDMRRMNPVKAREIIEKASSLSSRFHHSTKGGKFGS